jgi:hypothetical protein
VRSVSGVVSVPGEVSEWGCQYVACLSITGDPWRAQGTRHSSWYHDDMPGCLAYWRSTLNMACCAVGHPAPPPPRPLTCCHPQERHIRRLQKALSSEYESFRAEIDERDNSTTYAELQHAASLVRRMDECNLWAGASHVVSWAPSPTQLTNHDSCPCQAAPTQSLPSTGMSPIALVIALVF